MVWGRSNAQPAITNIDPTHGFIGSDVIITGSGFGTNPADVVVWFGSAKGAVASVANNLIIATVPAGAQADNITVVNLATGLSVQSMEKFYPVYSGSGFDPALLAPPVIIPDAKQVYDPCTCDLNGDGLPDVISTKFDNATNLLILENQSTTENFSFSSTSVNVGQPTVNVKCADFNGDGKPDLYMSRGGTTRFNVFVLPNTSAAGISFGTMLTLPMATDVQSRRVTHGDLNGDGKPEIIVTNSAAGQVIIFENTSTATISFNMTPIVLNIAGASSTTGLDVQDVDGDGRLDIIVCQFFGNDVFVLRNTGTGSIAFAQAEVLSLSGKSLLNLTTGDFNGNGKLDIAVIGNAADQVFIFPNNSDPGNINFAAPQPFTVNDGPWGISTGDVDGDGSLDIVTTSVNQNLVAVLQNTSSGGSLAFTKHNIDIGNRSRNVWVNDLDGDAKPDFVITAQNATNPPTSFDVRLIRNTNCYTPQFLNDQPLAICSGQTITLAVPESPSATFSWTKDNTPIAGTNNTLDITSFGVYEVTAITESGACNTTASINIADGTGTIPGAPTASNDGPACIGGELTLSVNTVNGATYNWTGPNGFTSTVQNPVITGVSNNVAGIYSVTIQSGDCRSSESTTMVEVVDLPQFTASVAGTSSVCAGNTVALSTQSRSGFGYQWLRDNNPISGATSSSYSATQSGQYSVLIDDNNSNCSLITNIIEVNVYSSPTASFSVPASACSNSEVTFTNNSTIDSTAPVVYSWNFGDGNTSADQNPTHVYASSGNYTVQLSISYTGITGCTHSQSRGITVRDPLTPVIEASSEEICPDEELTLGITGTFNSILWDTGETSNNITVNTAGTYSVTVNDTNGCDATSDITITSGTVPDVQVTADRNSISQGDQAQLTATGADSYLWTPDTGLSDPDIANPIASPEITTTYIVTGTLTDGCSATAEITIIVSAGGEVNITPLKAFSPNSTINPTWTIENIQDYPDCTMSIFDERGALVFRKKGYNNDWDATYKGGELPKGVYYYVFGCETLKPKTGTVLVVR
ncbi:hypothetical protein C900_03612 [Fulvivirga imtechensis AK7]|uniref:PKD domain-containing protein n=2 Tax=Fulvivirga TaxID=396811 RepID=L8JNU0_9BACT|nr:hypothetical protein C900_03612 [Fulvivirga imtechensis AK7]